MKRLSVPAASAALWCILSAPALAAGTGEDAPLDLGPAQESASSGGGGLARTIVGLAVVVGVIFGLHWVLKQVKASREASASGEGLESLATLPLGPNRAVHVVRVGSEVLVLGATEHGIARLRVLGEEEAAAAGLTAAVDVPEVIDAAPVRPRPAQALAPALDTLRAWTVRR